MGLYRISAVVKEVTTDCIRIDEVAAALKKMKRQSPRLVRASSRNDTFTGKRGMQGVRRNFFC